MVSYTTLAVVAFVYLAIGLASCLRARNVLRSIGDATHEDAPRVLGVNSVLLGAAMSQFLIWPFLALVSILGQIERGMRGPPDAPA